MIYWVLHSWNWVGMVESTSKFTKSHFNINIDTVHSDGLMKLLILFAGCGVEGVTTLQRLWRKSKETSL